MLDTGVILEAVGRQILAVARALEATMWHLGNDWDVGIDPDTPKVKSFGHTHCGAVVLGPDR